MYDHFLAVLFHATGEQLTDEEVDQRYRWHSCASIISNTSLNKLNFTCDGKDYSYSVLDVDVCCSLLLWRCPCCCGDVCCWPVNSRSASSTMRFSPVAWNEWINNYKSIDASRKKDQKIPPTCLADKAVGREISLVLLRLHQGFFCTFS